MTEDEMVGWHHRFNGHESEQALGVDEGQGSLVCCSPQGHKGSDMTERLNNNNNKGISKGDYQEEGLSQERKYGSHKKKSEIICIKE